MTALVIRQFVCPHGSLFVFGWYSAAGQFIGFFNVGVN